MSKKKKKQKEQQDKHAAQKPHDDVLVAPVVARASDQNTNDVHETYLQASIDTSQKEEMDVASPRQSTQTHVHATCQSPLLRKKVKNLMSFVIFFAGLSTGLLFVDVAQFFSQRGLSARALGEARVVDYDGATWVKYDEPKVQARVFLSSHNSDQTHEKVDEVLSALALFMPTLEVRMTDVDTQDGAQLAKNLDIGHTPAIHFSSDLKDNAYYAKASDAFVPREDGSYFLKMDVVEVDVDHYIGKPSQEGMVIGDIAAPHSVVVFENFLCESCNGIHRVLTNLQTRYPDDVNVVYKNIPDNDDEASKAGAYSGHCAYEQGQYDRYAQILFTNNAWKSVKPAARAALLEGYTQYIPGLDSAQFAACYGERRYDQQLITDVTEADYLGITSVPTVFLDGNVLMPTEDRAIDEVLATELQQILSQ